MNSVDPFGPPTKTVSREVLMANVNKWRSSHKLGEPYRNTARIVLTKKRTVQAVDAVMGKEGK
jgi:hypothetical protein